MKKNRDYTSMKPVNLGKYYCSLHLINSQHNVNTPLFAYWNKSPLDFFLYHKCLLVKLGQPTREMTLILPNQSLVAPTETLTCPVPCAINSNQPIANQASMLVVLKVSKRPIGASLLNPHREHFCGCAQRALVARMDDTGPNWIRTHDPYIWTG